MVDKVCIKKSCNWTRTHGYFCQKHRVVEPLVDPRTRCAAIGCHFERKSLTLFCGDHQRAMDRGTGYYASDKPIEPFRAPLPDRKCLPVRVVKAKVRWDGFQFVSVHPDFVAGFGASPGAAMRDMTKDYGDGIPF